MNKIIAKVKEIRGRYAFVALLLGIALATMGLSTAPVHSEGAVIITDVACYIFDGDGNTYMTTTSKVVYKETANGFSHLTCKGDNVPNSAGQQVTYDANNNPYATAYGYAIGCTDGLGHATIDWQEVVSASGQAMVQCHFKL